MENGCIKAKLREIIDAAIESIGYEQAKKEIHILLDQSDFPVKADRDCSVCKRRGVLIKKARDGFSIVSCACCGHHVLRYDGFARTVRHSKCDRGYDVIFRCYDIDRNQRVLELVARHHVELKSTDSFSLEYTRVKDVSGEEFFDVLFHNATVNAKARLRAEVREVNRFLKDIVLDDGSDLVTVREELDAAFQEEQTVLKLRSKYEPIMLDLASRVLARSLDHVDGVEGIAKAYAKIKRLYGARGKLAYTRLVFGRSIDEKEAIRICKDIMKQGHSRNG